jgi:hypothetical protein
MTLMVSVSTKHIFLDDVEKRAQVNGSNHPETVAILGHSTST